MYVTVRGAPATIRPSSPRVGQRVAGTVVLLGIVSMLTDISSESVNAILPIYLTSVLGMSTLAYGFIDGIYQGVSACVRIAGGWLADRADHPKWVAVVGYLASAVSRIFLIPATTLAGITSIITADRVGKGLRTAPRDALIAASSPTAALGRAFGVHRTLDTLGALIGPLMAFVIIDMVVPDDYHAVFVASLAFAIIGLAVLILVVPDLRPRRQGQLRSNGAAPSEHARPSWRHWRNPQFCRLFLAGGLLGLFTVGDGFLYLELTERDSLATKYFPLLYVGTNFAYLALAIPFGRLADRIGRTRVFVGGQVLLLVGYLCAGGPLGGPAGSIGCLVFLGGYYAATDGVLAAMASTVAPLSIRTSAIATAQTAVAAARFASSIGFGFMWVELGRTNAIWLVSGMLAAAIPLAALMMRGLDRKAVA
ncbi:MAG TPA: MFS transporter [Jatrophihabitans sp.]|nr:MFS transporter [Jatrophihabitans sp.]